MKPTFLVLTGLYFAAAFSVFSPLDRLQAEEKMAKNPDQTEFPENVQIATFGAGCFWCVEEFFHQTPGVASTLSGYMGGEKETAIYDKVKTGRTKHVEVVQVYFDPDKLSFDKLLDLFFDLHDPTTLNRQGYDRGPQYRSVVFFHDDLQKAATEKKIKELTAAKKFEDPIVTAVEPAEEFYLAEDYHQNYARLNPDNPYLHNVLFPKLKKLGFKIPTTGGEE
ncbi:MAG: peptide-methionine (S)-S-oxide reductase MsrA [Verrucomicrobiales bacterium]|nr:peptide-methionine (S)-S-oxide reductase MsrA [Verrucomicrobiales bacterium]